MSHVSITDALRRAAAAGLPSGGPRSAWQIALEPLLCSGLALAGLALLGALEWRWAMAGASLAVALAFVLATLRMQGAAAASATLLDGQDDVGRSRWRVDGPMLQELLSGIPDAAMVLDRRSIVVAANTASQSLFSVAPGKHLAQITRAPELLRAVDEAFSHGGSQALQFRLTPPHEQTLAARVTPLGEPRTASSPAILIVLHDMTEQEQLARMRADFVANASHELRTPLASLRGFVETLQGAAKDDPVARAKFLDIMEEQASRMSRLIEDLLSLSRIEMREHVAPSGAVDLAAVVEEVARDLRPFAAKAGVDLVILPDNESGMVVGDREELAQVAQNLMQNAIKYGRKGGKVEVSVVASGQRMILSVKDDGIGIAPQHLPRLTERFYRVNARESRERGGTGLGLAIVKHIVSRHRGELRVTSELGRGSTFAVLIPQNKPKTKQNQ